MKPSRLVLALALFAAACASTPTLPPGEIVGEELLPQEIVAFASVDAEPEPYFERTVLVEATATAVCQAAGCWMQIEDQGRTAMVRWETGCGGKYAFPPEIAGQRVVIQGSVYPVTLSDEDLEHLQAEAGEDIEIRREGYEFNASSVLVLEQPAG